MGPLMIDVAGEVLADEERPLLSHRAVGGVILFARNYRSPRQIRRLVASIRAAAGRELLVAVDQEGGRVQRMREGFSALSPARTLGDAYDRDPEQARQMARARGRVLALELGAVDIDFTFAPVLDLDYGRSAVIGDRALHSDPAVVTELALAFVEGARSEGMACVVKHFPGHGWVEADSHLETPVDSREYEALGDDLLPFEKLADAGVEAVMAAHVQYPAVDAATPCFSDRWLQQELRQRMGFAGVIFADDLSMHGAALAGSLGERAAAALRAGCDMLPVCNNPDRVRDMLRDWSLDAVPGAAQRLAALRRKAG